MKRGQLSIEQIVLIILAILTLVLVAAAFSGGMANLWNKISGISSTIPEADTIAAKAVCQEYCDKGLDVFCTHKFEGSLKDMTCKKLVSCANSTLVASC